VTVPAAPIDPKVDIGHVHLKVADLGVSEALYLRDPDQNGIELYWDRPRELWPKDSDGRLTMHTRPLNLGGLLAEGTDV